MTLLKLPPEIHVQIIEHFDWHSFLHYRHTCKYFYSITETLSLKRVWLQVRSFDSRHELLLGMVTSGLVSKYNETYALCLTIFAMGIDLSADVSAFRETYTYVGKAKMFQVYKELQTTRGLSLIALGYQLDRFFIFALEYGLIIDLECMCLDILAYTIYKAIDADDLKQCYVLFRHLVRDVSLIRFGVADKMMPSIRAYEAETRTHAEICQEAANRSLVKNRILESLLNKHCV